MKGERLRSPPSGVDCVAAKIMFVDNRPSTDHPQKVALVVRAFDDFQFDRVGQRVRLSQAFCLSIAAIGKKFCNPWKQTTRLADQVGSAVAVLDVAGITAMPRRSPIRIEMTCRPDLPPSLSSSQI